MSDYEEEGYDSYPEDLYEEESEMESEAEDENDEIYAFENLSPEQIFRQMEATLKSISEVMPQVSMSILRTLLNKFKWNKDTLLEKFYTDPEKFLEQYQINLDDKEKSLESAELVCNICFDEFPKNEIFALKCNHNFCLLCWNSYLENEIEDQRSQMIYCPYSIDCKTLVDDKIVIKLLMEPKVVSRYQHLITESFVRSNRLLKWCPAPDCTRAIKVNYVDSQPVVCSCGQVFCFGCDEKWHLPISCKMLQKWNKKSVDDSENVKWFTANTKNCPKCNFQLRKMVVVITWFVIMEIVNITSVGFVLENGQNTKIIIIAIVM